MLCVVMSENGLMRKLNIDFKIYGIIYWEKNYDSTHIVQHLKN